MQICNYYCRFINERARGGRLVVVVIIVLEAAASARMWVCDTGQDYKNIEEGGGGFVILWWWSWEIGVGPVPNSSGRGTQGVSSGRPSLPPFNFCIDLLHVLGFDHDDHDRIWRLFKFIVGPAVRLHSILVTWHFPRSFPLSILSIYQLAS